MIKEVKKGDVPEWDFGDVAIKTYSFGEQMSIVNMSSKIKEVIENGKKEYKPEINEDLNVGDLSLFILCAGLHYIRDVSGEGWIIKPNSTVEEKKKVVFNFNSSSGNYLLSLIKDLNKGLDEEQKKN